MMNKFYIFKQEYNYIKNISNIGNVGIYGGTSVIEYLKWFFNCLKFYGRIVLLDIYKVTRRSLRLLLKRENAILIKIYFQLSKTNFNKVPHRLLWLTLGNLLLPCHIRKHLPSAEINLVSTQFQKDRISNYLGSLAPKMTVFPPKIDTEFFIIPNKTQRLTARKRYDIQKGQVNIVYAGRWLVTKGICQLIRSLEIWPNSNIILTIVGNVDINEKIRCPSTNHETFQNYIDQEVLRGKKKTHIRFYSAKDKYGLRELFWSADLFVYLSTHPDENYGITPREAMSCGIPVLATNYGGLQPITEYMPWKGVDTYPSYSGARFSIKQFRLLLQKAIGARHLLQDINNRKYVINECNPERLKNNLKGAIEYLNKRNIEKPLVKEDTENAAFKRIFRKIGNNNYNFLANSQKSFPNGTYVYGNAPHHYALSLVQGIFTTSPKPPKVTKGSKWRGFFRISLLEKENAVIEFGFPGPRVKRYSQKKWGLLIKSAHYCKPNEYVFVPINDEQISIIQELVSLGYLVPDDYYL